MVEEVPRPAEVQGRQPTGARLGFQGPDQGYALTLAPNGTISQ